MNYQIYTEIGMSGGAVFIQNSLTGDCFLVGMHQGRMPYVHDKTAGYLFS